MNHSRGFILVTSLIFLLIITLLGVSMFSSSGIQTRMAGNIKAKTEADMLAESALRHAETLLLDSDTNPLAQQTAANGCVGALTVPTICARASSMAVAAVQNASSVAAYRTQLTGYYADTSLPNVTITSTPGTPNSTYAAPEFYIQSLGTAPDGAGQLYQITALGYGGTPNAVSVLQADYEIKSGVTNLGGL